jgi:hypothetical protein
VTHAAPCGARRAIGRLAALAALWSMATGCVYFNGVYNATDAAHAGDARLDRGNEADASSHFLLSAARAESVLVRHPKSKWRSRALYLAGRGAAYGNECAKAVPRLTEYLAIAGTDARERESARVAMGVCETRALQLASARARFDSLLDSRHTEIARQARLWGARAAIASGDRDAVPRYLQGIDATALQWELVQVSLAAGEFARVESLIVQRAARGDYRDDVTRAVRDLWGAGQWDAAERIVAGYDLARAGDANRASMHYALGDLSLRAGRDSMARQHLFTARALAGKDTVMERESLARLALIGMSRMAQLREVDTAFSRQDSAVLRTAVARRAGESLLLLKLLEQRPDPTGAALFLAAEVARDSLRAPRLARTLFLRVAREVIGSPLAPNALHAAALLEPDSAAEWSARIRADYPASYVAAWLAGDDPATRPDFTSTPELLRFQWTAVTNLWSDSVRKLRAPPRPPVPAARR